MTVTNLVGRLAPFAVLTVLTACGSAPTSNAQASSTPSSSPSTAASPPATPIVTPSTAPGGSIDLSSCPAYAAGQHPLGAPGPPGTGVHADPTLDWSGCGSLTLPPGTARFMTGDNWQLGFATTCPNDLNYGPGGMGPNVTFDEVLIDGTSGPDSQGGAGPWTDSGGSIMAHGGNYQLRVTSIDPRCRWHVAVYPS